MRLPAWILGLVLPLVALAITPLLIVGASWLDPQTATWQHLLAHVLPDVVRNTAVLAFGVGLGVGVLGVGLAGLTSLCNFPGRSFFASALVFPLAFPTYVLAFVYVGLLDFSGPVQEFLRAFLGIETGFSFIRSTAGAVLVFSLALYPYVYLLARQAFISQGMQSLQAAQTLGLSRGAAVVKLAIPMARPWIIAGISLALMEVLADFGAVAIFNVDTFTTAIFKTWMGMFNLSTASQLASLLTLMVLLTLALEQRTRRYKRYVHNTRNSPALRISLNGLHAWLASGFCGLVLLLAFVIPMLQLLFWAVQSASTDLDPRYWGFVWHTLALSGLTAVLVLIAALALVLAQRHAQGRSWPASWVMPLVRTANLGYAMPGMVLAVGLYIPIAWLDKHWLPWAQASGWQHAPTLKATILVLALALMVRFLAVGFNPLQSAMERISSHQEQAARTLGLNTWKSLWRVHLPLLRPGIWTGFLLVFVEVMKEMPITLMTRPFGWDTLAVRVFEMTSEGMWERAALPAVWIVAVSLLPILLIIRESEHT